MEVSNGYQESSTEEENHEGQKDDQVGQENQEVV
jgi:hypothetical protein